MKKLFLILLFFIPAIFAQTNLQKGKKYWNKYFKEMKLAYNKQLKLHHNPKVSTAEKIKGWKSFLKLYLKDNPHSSQDEQMRLKSRKYLENISGPLDFIHKCYITRPIEIIVNGKKADRYGELPPGKYNFIIKFKRYKTIRKTIEINPKKMITIDLVTLKNFEFKINKKYYNLKIDGIKYPLQIYANDKQLEDHHINLEDVGPVVYYNIYAPIEMHSIKVIAGFYKGQSSVKRRFEFRDLREIDVELLLKHLQKLTKKQALMRVQKLLQNKTDRNKLSKKDQKTIAKFINGHVFLDKQ